MRADRTTRIINRCRRYLYCRNKKRLLIHRSREPWINSFGNETTSLLWRAYYHRRDMFFWMLTVGFDPEVQDTWNGTILMHSAGENDLKAMAALLIAGAGVDRQNQSGETALGYAIAYNQPEAVSQLLTAGADPAKPYCGCENYLHFAKTSSDDRTAPIIENHFNRTSAQSATF